MAFLPGAILIFTLTGALAGPLWGSSQCATTCPESSKFRYTPGTTFDYDFESNILTHVPGATQDTSSLRLRATARIQAISQCEFMLSLSDSSLEDSRGKVDKSRDFSQAVESKSLRFAYVDGKVENICPQSEKTWILNIKRGILSSLQNTMESLDTDFSTNEVDISGTCPVKYTVTSGGVSKVKDILACTEDHSHETVFHGIPYNTDSSMQNLPLLRSHHECKQLLNNGIISQTTCTEKHVFRPFSRENSGATTEVTSTLTFKSKINSVTDRQDSVSEKLSLAFDFTPSPDEMERNMNEAQGIMAELCKQSHEDIRPDVPALFTKLVRSMRKMNMRNLETFYGQSKPMCDQADKFFRDAVPMLGTAASVEFIADMVVTKQSIVGTEAEIWLTAQSFIARPTADLLSKAMPLLNAPADLKRKATLAVSSMVNNFCRVKPDCENTREVQDIISKFEAGLNYNCKGDHDDVMLMLKAIGNTGHAARLSQTLTRCINNEELSVETRVVAVNAFRRLDCQVDRSDLMRLFSDKTVDSELRINAYLQIMVCPSALNIAQVKTVLDSEEVNQVGSFVWTHLTNLMESSCPLKQDVAKILLDERLQSSFNLDKRKFSRNVEWSLFSHLLNSGAAVESNIIFSEKSFVPRSGMVNLTVDVFGHSMNLLELGGRVEGMDRVLEEFFGPKKSDNLNNNGLLTSFDRAFGAGQGEQPKANYYMKMFGNEIRYGDFHNIDLAALKDKMNFLNWIIDLANEHDIEVTKSMSFLDTTMTVPTSAGLPLKLSADGTFSLNIKVKGKMDMRRAVDIQGTISPSGAVEITSDMGVDAFFAQTGLRMVATLHSSTIVQGSIKQEDGKFTMDIDTPRDKVEIFDLKTRFFIEDREQDMMTDNVVADTKCWDATKALGMKVCGEYSLPLSMSLSGPMFPFTGPTTVSLTMQKTDTHTGYHAEAKYQQLKERVGGELQVTDIARFAVDTPGSSVNREISLDFNLDRANYKLDLDMKSPWKTASFGTNYKNKPNKKSFSAILNADGATYASVNLNVPQTQQGDEIEYKPTLEVALPRMDSIKLMSTITVNPTKTEWMIRVRNVPYFDAIQDIKTQGSLISTDDNQRWKRDLTAQINAGDFKSTVNGYIDNEFDSSIASRLDVTYAYKAAKERFTLNSKIRDQSTRTITQFSTDGQWSSTMFKKYDGDFKLDFSKGRSNLGVKVDVGFDEENRVKLTEDFNWAISGRNKKISGLARVEVPAKKITYEVKLDHSNTDDFLTSNVDWNLGFHNGNLMADIKRESASPLKVTGKVGLQYPGRDLSWTQTVEEQNMGEFRSDVDIQLDPSTHVVVKSTYKMNPRHEISASLKYGNNNPIQFNSYLKPEARDLQAHAEVNFSGQRYAIDTNAKTTGDFGDFTSTGDLDLQWASRHITADAAINSQNGVHDVKGSTKWDADRDSNKQATIHTKLTTSSMAPALYVRVDCKSSSFVELDTSAKHETGLWWSGINDFQGVAKWKSSFQGWEQMDIKFKHDIKDFGFKTHFEGTKSGQSLSGDMILQRQGWNSVQTTLSMETPIDGWRKVDAAGNYKLRARGFDADAKLTYDGKTMSTVFSSQMNLNKHLFQVDWEVNTPFNGFKETTLSLKHNDDGQVFSSGMGATWGNGKSLNYQQDVTFIPMSTLNGKAKFVSTFAGWQKISVTSENVIKGKTYTGLHGLNVGSRSWSLEESLDYNLPTLKGSAKFSSDERPVVTMNLSHLRNGQTWESHAELEYGQNKKISVDNVFSWGASKKLQTTVTCEPCPYIGTSSLLLQMDGTMDDFSGKMELANNALMSDKISMNVNGKLADPKNMQIQMDYKSPVGVDSLSLEGTHNKQGRQFVSTLSMDVMGTKVAFNNKMTVVDLLNFDTSTTAQIGDRQVELDTKLKVQRGTTEASFAATGGNNRLSAALTLNGAPTDFRTTAEVNFNRFTYSGEGAFNMKNGIEITLSVKTPYGNGNGQVSHRGPWNNFNTHAEATIKRDTYKGDVTFSLKDFNLETSARAEMPSFVTEAKISHTGIPKDFTTHVEYTWGRQASSADLVFKLNGYSMDANLDINFEGKKREITVSHRGPITNFQTKISHNFPEVTKPKSLELQFEHSGEMDAFFNKAVTKVDSDIYSWANEFSFTARKMEVSSTVIIPQGQSGFKYSHQGSPKSWESDAELTILNEKSTMKINFDLGTDEVTIATTATTPFKQAETLSANFKGGYKKWSNWNFEGDFQLENLKYDTDCTFKMFGKTLSLVSQLSTPGQKHVFNVRHEGGAKEFNTNLVVASTFGRIKSSTSFSATNAQITGSTSLETPFRGYESSTLSFTATPRALKSEMEITATNSLLGRRPAVLKMAYDMTSDFSAEVEMTSDLEGMRNVGASIKASTGRNDYELASAAWRQNKRASVDAKFTVGAVFKGSVDVKTFSSVLRDFGGSFDLDTRKPFPTNGKVYWNSENVIEATVKFTIDPTLDTSVEVKTPFRGYRTMTASVTHNGQLKDFESFAKLSWERQEMTAEVKFNAFRKIGSLAITTPFNDFNRLGANFEISGEMPKIEMNGKVYWGPEITFAYKAEAGRKGGKESLDVTTPFQTLPKFGYSSEYEMEYGQQKISYDMKHTNYWGNTNRNAFEFGFTKTAEHLDGKVVLTVYGMDDMGVSFNYDGPWNAMKSTGKIYWTRDSKIEGSADFNMSGNSVNGQLQITTPFYSVQKMGMSFAHDGTWTNTKDSANFHLNEDKITITHVLEVSRRAASGNLEITTPFKSVRQVSASFSHNGPWKKFDNTAEFNVNDMKFTFKSNFAMAPQTKGSLEMTSPRNKMSASFSHSGQWKDFQNEATFEMNMNKFTINNEFSLTGLTFKAVSDITTPFRGFKTVSMRYDHNHPDMYNFKCDAGFSVEGQSATWMMDFSFDDNLKVLAELTTPFDAVRQMKLDLDHSAKSYRNFESSASFEHNNQMYTAGLKFAFYGKTLVVDCDTTVPGFQKFSVSLNHKGSWSDYQNSLNVFLGDGKKIKLASQLTATAGSVDASAEITVPHCIGKNVVTFNHQGDLANFETAIKLVGDKVGDSWGASAAFKKDTMEGSVSVNTPERNAMVSFKHTGGLVDFQTEANVECAGAKWSGLVTFKKTMRTISGEVSVQTPRNGKYSASIDAGKNRDGWNVILSNETPFRGYEKNSLTLKQMGAGSMMAALSLGSDVYSATWVSTDSNTAFIRSLTVTTPVRNFEKMMIEVTVGRGQNVDITARVETSYPKYETMSATVSHSGDLSQFDSKAAVSTSHPAARQTAFTVGWKRNSNRGFTGNFELNTPVRGFEQVKGDITLEKSSYMVDLKANLDTSMRGMEHFDVELKGSLTGDDVSVDFSANTPLEGFESWKAGMKHSGGMRSFETTGSITTPLSILPSADLKVNHRGDLEDFVSTAQCNGQAFDIKGSLKWSGVKLTVKTPFDAVKSFELSASHDSLRSGSVDFLLNGIQRLDLDYSTKESPMQLTLNMRQPRPFLTTININKQGESLSADVTVNWRSQNVNMKMTLNNSPNKKEFSFESTLPSGRPVKFSTNLETTGDKLSHDMSVQWNNGQANKASYQVEMTRQTSRSQVLYDGKVKISTPWYTKEASISHTTNPGRQYTTKVVVEGRDRLVITNDYVTRGPTCKNTFTIQHPRLSRDISVVTEATLDLANMNVEASLQANVESEELSISGKMQDQSNGNENKYIAAFKATHPSTVTDISFDHVLTINSEKLESSTELKHMTSRDGQLKVISLKAEMDSKSLNVEFTSPARSVKLNAKPTVVDRANGIYQYTVMAGCEKNQVKLEAFFNWQDKKTSLTFGLNGASMTAAAEYESTKSMALIVKHSRNGQREIEDVVLALSPRGNRAINTRSYYRPNAVEDLQNYVSKQYPDNYWSEPMDALTSTIKEDLRYKANYFKSRTVPVLKKVSNILFGEDATLVLAQGFSTAGDFISTLAARVGAKMSDVATSIGEVIYNCMLYTRYTVETVSYYVMAPIRAVVHTAVRIPFYMQDKVSSMVDAVQQHPLVQKVASFAPTEYLQTIRDTGRRYRRSVEAVAAEYSGYMAVASDVWDNVARRGEVRSMTDYMKQAQDYAQWAYDHYEVEDTAKMVAQKASEYTWDNVQSRAKSYVGDMFQDSQVNQWEPEQGNVDVDIAMPTRFPDMSLPNIDLKQYVVAVMEWLAAVQKVMSQDRYTFMDLVYTYKPSSDVFDILPPFKARASLSGTQNYLTFDKTFYPFAGDCSYLLTRDFINGEFAAIVNYQSSRGGQVARKSISVYSQGSEMEIFPDGTVKVDGNMRDAPIQIGNLTVQREGDLLKLDSGNGFQLECNLANDHCTVLVSGWYYGKTAGLLGTYDNEPYTDLMSKDRSLSGDVSQFAASWASGRRCSSDNKAREQTAFPGSPTYDICAKFFVDRNSPLRSGFRVVDPASYMKMCMNAMPVRRQSVADACKTISLYISECNSEGVHLTPPVDCVKCKRPDGTMFTEGTTVELSGADIPRSADVIFVVEESECNAEVGEKLMDIATTLKDSLAQKGLTGNNFGVVGFGGYGSHQEPHTHSMNGKVMSTFNDFRQGLNSFQFASGNNGDAMKAVKFAANYPFRTGVSKTVVLITCNTCERKSVDYAELVQQLQNTDVRMHVVMDHEFQLKSESKKAETSYLYGHDETGVYTFKNAGGNLDSDSDIFSHVTRPKDLCAAAAISSKGTVFNAGQLIHARPANQKRFLAVLTGVWAASAEPSRKQECVCVADQANVGRSVCQNATRSSFFDMIFNFVGSSESSEEVDRSVEAPVEVMERQFSGRRAQRQ